MKKLIAFALFLSTVISAQVAAAQVANDQTVRMAVATQETVLACQIRDDLATLSKLAARRSAFLTAYADSDFSGSAIPWVNAYNANGLFDFVNADISTVFAANSGRDQTILEQMCGD